MPISTISLPQAEQIRSFSGRRCSTTSAAEIDNGHADFNDDQVLAVLRKEVKQRKETLSEIESSGREDLVEQTKAEIDVLEKYLPAEMTPEAVEAAVKEIGDAMDPGQKNMGSVMKAVMAKLKGQADGKLINQIVRKLLA